MYGVFQVGFERLQGVGQSLDLSMEEGRAHTPRHPGAAQRGPLWSFRASRDLLISAPSMRLGGRRRAWLLVGQTNMI